MVNTLLTLFSLVRYGKNITERNVQGTSNPVSNDGVLVVETLVRAR